jgi:hypothetical protein
MRACTVSGASRALSDVKISDALENILSEGALVALNKESLNN